jgi:hypothetical protein
MKNLLKSVARRFGVDIRRLPPPPAHAVFFENPATDSDLLALRNFADQVARFSASAQESRAICNLYLTGILREQPSVEVSRIEIGNADTMQVGIWRKQSRAKDAPFVRMTETDWFSWAKKETIEPKRRKWRVALIGESVARGYLYDPELTPASVLEQMLRAHLGTSEIEVVDLAMSSLTMQPLKTLIGQSLALSPDVIVVFAGNNWHMQLKESDVPYIEGPLRKRGVPALKSYIDGRVGRAVRQLTAQVDELVSGRNLTVIWVVPESNLDDWNDPAATAPLLPDQGNREWRDLSVRASVAIAKGELALAEKLAREMVNLDGATTAVPLRILAECCRLNGDARGLRRYLELCRDGEGWNPSFAYTPRTSAVIQSALREADAAPKHVVVDLRETFSRYLDGAAPNRRVFLDYCHLTGEGISVAMAAVGARVLQSIGCEPVSIEKLQSRASSIAGEVEGRACLLAAIHNAHYFQGYELASYWCERALRFWPKSAEIMKRFADFQTRRGDIMACKSAIELFGSRELRTLTRGGRKRLDLSLIDAMASALAAAGIDIRDDVSELRAAEHSLRSGSKELTDFYYSSTMLRPSEFAWTSKSFSTNRASHCIYASAFWETSKFVFFGERGRAVGLKLTYRVPGAGETGGRIRVELNGQELAQAPAEAAWRTFEINVAGDYVVDGLNEIVITWPDEGEGSGVLLNRAADALLARRVPHFYRVFGEIHSLLAFDLSAASPAAEEAHSASSEAMLASSSEAGLVAAP